MSELFSLEDMFNVMIELETLGNIHYTNMKSMTDNIRLKVLFEKLALAELAHKVLYEQFKLDIINYKHEKVDDEYKSYIASLLRQTILFLSESRNVTEFDQGFTVSIRLEKDTILFLNEIRSIVDATYYESIDKIIEQEEGHLKALYEYRDNIN